MNLKNILKQIKMHESSISTVLGFVVIVVVGLLVVNYFRNTEDPGQLDSLADSTEQETTLASHTIAEGESLWTIAEEYYDDGFRWTDIMEANGIENPADIEVGQTIMIPNATAETTDVMADASAGESGEVAVMEETETPEPTAEPTIEPTATPEPEVIAEATTSPEVMTNGQVIMEDQQEPATNQDGTYTVVHGDNLWDIAVAVYGDGYRWTDIASANNLVNPGVIHAGNVFVIPA